MESWFLDGKTPNSAEIDQFLGHNNGIIVFRWKDAKFGRNGIDQFLGP